MNFTFAKTVEKEPEDEVELYFRDLRGEGRNQILVCGGKVVDGVRDTGWIIARIDTQRFEVSLHKLGMAELGLRPGKVE